MGQSSPDNAAADALHALSAGQSPPAQRPNEPIQPDEAPDEEVFEAEAEVDDESGRITAMAASQSAGAASARSRAYAPRPSNGGAKAVFAPVIMTVGLIMLVPAVWAVLQLKGISTSERPDADQMAKIMLACWPIALSLIGAGVFFMLQVAKEKKNR